MLQATALARSLSEIASRHEALRTTFAAVEGRPMQVFSPPAPLELPLVDLGELSEGEREAEVRRLADTEAREPFDLARGPLWRARRCCP